MNLFMAKKYLLFFALDGGSCINLGLTASSKEEEDKASGQVPSGSGRGRSREEEDRPQQSLEARGRVC